MNAPDARWENTDFGRRLLDALTAERQLEKNKNADMAQKLHAELNALQDAMQRACGPLVADLSRTTQIIEAFQVLFASIYPTKIVQVEGPVLFRYSFCRLEGRVDRRGVEALRVPVARWSIHDLQRGKLVLVRQYRLRLLNEQQRRWKDSSERMDIRSTIRTTSGRCHSCYAKH